MSAGLARARVIGIGAVTLVAGGYPGRVPRHDLAFVGAAERSPFVVEARPFGIEHPHLLRGVNGHRLVGAAQRVDPLAVQEAFAGPDVLVAARGLGGQAAVRVVGVRLFDGVGEALPVLGILVDVLVGAKERLVHPRRRLEHHDVHDVVFGFAASVARRHEDAVHLHDGLDDAPHLVAGGELLKLLQIRLALSWVGDVATRSCQRSPTSPTRAR